MMFIFWLIIFLMILLALVFVIKPLIKQMKLNVLSEKDLDLTLRRERLYQLNQDFEQRNMNEADYKENKLEIERGLLAVGDNDIKIDLKVKDQGPSYRLAILLAVLLPLAAIMLYFHWGASNKVVQAFEIQKRTQEIKIQIARMGSPDKIIQELKMRVEANPKDARGWYLLGRLYFSAGQFQPAINAYKTANQLKPNTAEIMTSYAESEFFLHNRKLTTQAHELLNKVLKQNPNYINALDLLAVNAYFNKNYQLAINYWQRIILLLPSDSKDEKQLQKMIAGAARDKERARNNLNSWRPDWV